MTQDTLTKLLEELLQEKKLTGLLEGVKHLCVLKGSEAHHKNKLELAENWYDMGRRLRFLISEAGHKGL